MKKNYWIAVFVLFLLPRWAVATVDVRLGGGLGLDVANNNDNLPLLDEGYTESFFTTGYNVDVIMSDYWIVIGARAEETRAKTETFFYFDQNTNQYTKYGVKTKSRVYSGLFGVHFELNTPESSPDGREVKYSAGILAVIPFDQSNDVEVESRDATTFTQSTGSAQEQNQWAIYFEANRSISGGFTSGLQLGYRHHTLKQIEDPDGNDLTNYNGVPLELDLSSVDFRVFIGVRF